MFSHTENLDKLAWITFLHPFNCDLINLLKAVLNSNLSVSLLKTSCFFFTYFPDGLHSAMQHDNIMQSSHPDYAIVEGEADRVAREAARALKRSRQQCYSATSGMPTWTGQSGVSK